MKKVRIFRAWFSQYWLTWFLCRCRCYLWEAHLFLGQPYWFTRILGLLSTFLPAFPLTLLLSSGPFLPLPLVGLVVVSFPLPHFFPHGPSIPPLPTYVLVDLLPRLVALQAADPTDWTTFVIGHSGLTFLHPSSLDCCLGSSAWPPRFIPSFHALYSCASSFHC